MQICLLTKALSTTYYQTKSIDKKGLCFREINKRKPSTIVILRLHDCKPNITFSYCMNLLII